MIVAIYTNHLGELDGWAHINGIDGLTDKDFMDLMSTYDVHYMYDFRAKGRSYRERQAYVEQKAIEWSWAEQPSWSWGEIADIQNAFELIGRRYGLLRDFRENAIC